jgi:hypothetical protein
LPLFFEFDYQTAGWVQNKKTKEKGETDDGFFMAQLCASICRRKKD